MLSPSTFTALVTPDYVTYTLASPQGTFVIRVFTGGLSPRLLCFVSHDNGNEREPLSMFFSELTDFANDAIVRSRGSGAPPVEESTPT
jgi:hypothetical protein